MTAQCLVQLDANIWSFSKWIGWVAALHYRVETGFGITQRFWVAVDIKLVQPNGIEHHKRDLRSTDFATAHGFVAHSLPNELTLRGLGGSQMAGAVSFALVDTGWHKVRAQHAGTHLISHQVQILVI